MTNQPNWELVGNLGDVNVADYGGFLIYRDTTGVYPPEAEIYEPNENENGGIMYRVILDRPRFRTLTAPGKSNFSHYRVALPANERNVTWYWYNEWFVDKLSSIADSCGTTKFKLLRLLFSESPMDRGMAYQMIVGNFGPYEFDQYPVTLTEREAQKRYKYVTVALCARLKDSAVAD